MIYKWAVHGILQVINDLTVSLLGSSSLRRIPTPFSLGVYLCLPSLLTKQSLSGLSHMLGSVSNNKLCICFHSFCLLETFLLSSRAGARGTLLLISSLAVPAAKIPGFHPGYPCLIPGQGTRILLQAISQGCLLKIKAYAKSSIY